MSTTFQATLKRLRYSQPFNRVATGAARSLCRLVGGTPEVLPRHLHRVGDVFEALPNGETLHLRSKGDDWVTNLVFWKGWKAYEPGTIDLFYRLAGRANVILDIGAYVGFFTLVGGLANRNARIYAFEAMEPIHRRLLENVERNGLKNVECVNAAVGDSNGQARFFFSMAALREGLPTSSSLSESFMAKAPELTGVDVPLLTIDTFSETHSIARVDLVKIDTETTEPSVLRGMRQVLSRDRPAIVCEVLQRRADTAAIESELRPLGYKFFLLTPDGPEPRESIEGHPEFLNFLFTANPGRDLT
jgi:FkbM family methyltransferase